jgi:hypothetical protein
MQMADTVTLTDHDEIRSWAAARAGFPAVVDVSPESGTQAMLRLVFDQQAYEDEDRPERPPNAGGYDLVEWDEWFKIFDERQLALVVAADEPGRREEFPSVHPKGREINSWARRNFQCPDMFASAHRIRWRLTETPIAIVIHGRSKERGDARRPEDPCREI